MISHSGEVFRDDVDRIVTLTATLTFNDMVNHKIFVLKVLALDEDIDYGKVEIDDYTPFINSNRVSTYALIETRFSNEARKEKLTYQVVSGDSRAIMIGDDDVIVAKSLVNTTLVVKAESMHFSTEFNVNIIYHNYNDPDFEMFDMYNTVRFDANSRRLKLAELDLVEYTLVIGDSFTDDYFIGSLLNEFAQDQYIVSAGIGSTTSFHWESVFSQIIGNNPPKNIVLNRGTNNFYGANATVLETVSSIQRLFLYIHNKYPETKIYYFSISQRSSTTYANQVVESNQLMKAYCDQYDYLTFIDVSLDSSDIYDGIHPNHQGYMKIFTQLLASGIEIISK